MSEETFECKACGAHYLDEETMKKCYQYCAEYNACNLEILKESIEYKQNQK